MFKQNTSISQDHALRRDVLRVRGDLDKRKSYRNCLRKQESQGAFGVALALLPRHHRVTDVSQAVGRKYRRSWLPPEPDASRKLAIPQPTSKARNPRNRRTVWKFHPCTFRLAVVEARDECICVGFDFCQFVARSDYSAFVVGGPAPLKSCNVACEMYFRWTDELHRGEDLDA